jgi:hypothetical protein
MSRDFAVYVETKVRLPLKCGQILKAIALCNGTIVNSIVNKVIPATMNLQIKFRDEEFVEKFKKMGYKIKRINYEKIDTRTDTRFI